MLVAVRSVFLYFFNKPFLVMCRESCSSVLAFLRFADEEASAVPMAAETPSKGL